MRKGTELLGIVIEAERVLVALGVMTNTKFPRSLANLKLSEGYQWSAVITEPFEFERFFDELFESIFEFSPNIENIGVSCYGPFKEQEPFANKMVEQGIAYTVLGQTSGKRHLSGRPLKADLIDSIKRAKKKLGQDSNDQMPGLWIETDVASEALGYSHLFLKSITEDERKKMLKRKARVTALIKAEHGIGGTFIKLPERTAWHGVSHTEVGQMNLRKYSGDFEFFRVNKLEFPDSIYKHSVESMASIPALEYYTNETFEALRQRPNDPVWDREAWYLAQLAWCLTCSISPNHIIFSGKILLVDGLVDKIREEFKRIKVSKEHSIPNYEDMHKEEYIDSSIQDSIEEVSFDNPAIRGALCFAALTSESISLGLASATTIHNKSL